MKQIEFIKPNKLKFKGDMEISLIEGITIELNEILTSEVLKMTEAMADLKDVKYMTSISIGVFIQFTRKFDEKGIKLHLVNVNSNIYKMFDVSGALKILNVVNII